jgi:hypothetical protein
MAGCNGSPGAGNGNGGCAPGHEGPFCSLCSKNFTRFSETADCKACPSGEDAGGAVAALIGIIAGGLVAVVLYALFNHMIPKGALKPLINGMQCTSGKDEIKGERERERERERNNHPLCWFTMRRRSQLLTYVIFTSFPRNVVMYDRLSYCHDVQHDEAAQAC